MDPLEDKIIELEAKSLSGKEILTLLNGKTNLMTYPELSKYDNIDKALGAYNCLVILYLTREHYGHWCCLFKINDSTLHFFDSYGIIPDDELNFVDENMRKHLKQSLPHLTYLIYKSNYALDYNDYRLQQKGKGISTCGRHVVTRICYKNLPIDEYVEMILNKNMDPDMFVTLFTYELSGYKI